MKRWAHAGAAGEGRRHGEGGPARLVLATNNNAALMGQRRGDRRCEPT